MNTTEAPVHPLVASMPSKVLYGRGSSALIWLERNREPGQVMPTLADLSRERQHRRGRPALLPRNERNDR